MNNLKPSNRLKYCGISVTVLCPPEMASSLKESFLEEDIIQEMDWKKLLIKAKIPVIFSVFTILSNGCGYYCDVETCTYEAATQEDWLPGTISQALEFWADKGVFLEQVEENADIKVEAGDPVTSGAPGEYAALFATITLDREKFNLTFDDLTEQNTLELHRKCTMAHEMGHSFGMNHVENTGLMLATATIGETDCLWSDEDQAELDRILNQ